MYLVVDEPFNYNPWGIKIDKNKGKEPIFEEIEAPSPVDSSLFKHINFVVLEWMRG